MVCVFTLFAQQWRVLEGEKMKGYRLSGWMVLLVLMALILSACAGNNANEPNNAGNNGNVGGSGPGSTVEAATPEMDETAGADASLVTGTPDGSAALPSTGTPGADEQDAEMTTPAAETPTGEAVIPQTGEESTQVPEGANEEGDAVVESEASVFFSKLVGSPVQNEQGETLGEIVDLTYDEVTGQVIYGILGQEGGQNAQPEEGLVAIPWGTLGTEDPMEGEEFQQPESYTFNLDPALIDDAPRISQADLDEGNVEVWSEEVYPYWSQAGDDVLVAGVTETTLMHRLAEIKNFEVINGDTKQSHDVLDVVLDLFSGNLLYFVVDSSGLMEGQQGPVLIPYDFLEYGVMENGDAGYVFNVDEEMLKELPRLEEDSVQ